MECSKIEIYFGSYFLKISLSKITRYYNHTYLHTSKSRLHLFVTKETAVQLYNIHSTHPTYLHTSWSRLHLFVTKETVVPSLLKVFIVDTSAQLHTFSNLHRERLA